MCSIRNVRGGLMAAALAMAAPLIMMLGGCQSNVPEPVARLNDSPLIVDDAMQRREWDRSTSFYANGDTAAGGTGYMFQTHETINERDRRVVDPVLATMNIGLLPVGIFVNSPFKSQVYQGVVIPPTHTGMPALPQ